MTYEIIEATSTAKLAEEVKLRLTSGWHLVGGVSVAVYPREDRDGSYTEMIYCQAMTYGIDT